MVYFLVCRVQWLRRAAGTEGSHSRSFAVVTQGSGSQSVAPRPAASASPENLSELHILGPHSESQSVGVCLNIFGDSNAL